ncbi:hypothetical protein V7159_01410 [Priestia megaterium]|uniref:hypothetical protein n=2 Tax=Priestia megaterium TaxID=1404 RepID=UPI003009BA38
MADNMLEPKRSDQNLNFKDSWLQDTVELAALGTILTGAGTLAVKGDFSGAFRNGKRAIGAAGKGFENYLRRNGSMGTKFGYQVGKKVLQNLRMMPKPTSNDGAEQLGLILGNGVKEVDSNPEIQKRIRDEVSRRLQQEQSRNVVDKALDGSSSFPNTDPEARARYLYEKVRDEEIQKKLFGNTPSTTNKARRKRENGKPLFDKRQIAKDMVGAGLTGTAFGAGISGFHALDRASSNPDNQKKLEDTFLHAGSFLKKKEDNSMNKSASSLDVYKGLGGIAKKTPEAIASGIGFTGISLGTAKLLNGKDPRSPNDETDKDNQSTRVIIELGKDDQPKPGDKHSAMPMGLSGLPRLAQQNTEHMEKTALPSFNGLKQFARDFKGYGKQIDELKRQNPSDVAAARLRNENIPKLLEENYGNLAKDDHTKGHFTNKLFDSYTTQAKTELDDTVRDLETQTANARLKAGAGGLLAAGGGLAGLAAMKSKREENPQNGPS